MSLFDKNKAVMSSVGWPALALGSSALAALFLYLLTELFQVISPVPLMYLVVVSTALFLTTGGYMLTKRSHYEVYPTTRQVIGALVSGALGTAMIITLLSLLALSPAHLPLALYLIALALYFEFLTLRIAQGGRLTFWQILSTLVVIAATSFMLAEASTIVQTLSCVFITSAIAMEVASRLFGTYLLSPWVNSIWNGLAMLFLSLIAALKLVEIDIMNDITATLSLPLWVGLVIALLSVGVLLLRFLKQKVRVAPGYMQYKLQAWTLFLAFFGFICSIAISPALTAAFGVLVLGYAIAEGQVIVKE